ncbi:MFS transporter [Sphingomonas psychrolutea]|uniref:MFS transporter n=1 Tax=Sphingomonas psychrolutea TaxID=1259676 RepID=A0ABQ1G4L2_9SPHN|nr:MFS transporter [Sphingomonas psychrolutea]GGA36491.1 MFS transporter [Sphingomonas psychrolutea]
MPADPAPKPRLSLGRILQMNLGFLGLQFSFGLQQANMGPIYSFLGASEASMPLLWLAGPITGLLIQPIVGALSDRTVTRIGRRTPYFLTGAVLCSIALFAMPYSPALWVAASLLWLLDAANNITMEPYRAYVGDRLDVTQRPLGFLTQSAFTGLAQTLAYLVPSIFVWIGINPDAVDINGIPDTTRLAFAIGAVLSLSTILWSVWRVRELPLTAAQLAQMREHAVSIRTTWRDFTEAVRDMPQPMRRLALAMFCQWFGMFCYWQYAVLSLAHALHESISTAAVRDAALVNGRLGGFYNAIAFFAALALVPLIRRLGAGPVHAAAMIAAGGAMLVLPSIGSEAYCYLPMLGIGLGWASLMGTPYIMLADCIPPERTGIYMGIFNMFIVVPMLIESLTLPFFYTPVLGGDPRNVIMLGGVMLLLAAVATLRVGRAAAPQRLRAAI